jgi:hypothetical protein
MAFLLVEPGPQGFAKTLQAVALTQLSARSAKLADKANKSTQAGVPVPSQFELT